MSDTPEIELEQGFPECPNCFAEIDTWAAEKRAIEKERERIIALLEAEGCHCMPDPEAGKCYPHNLIAAIKGEIK